MQIRLPLEIFMTGSARRHAVMFRKPVRITITIAHATFVELERRSDEQGRSLSNLSAYLLEGALRDVVH